MVLDPSNIHAFTGILEIFVNPWLLAGLALLASPIVIHLLNKRHYTVVHWAAMDFLLQADSRNRRRLRFEDLLLLFLRMALLALVVFAVSRPLWTGWGGSREDERIVILDDSFSLEASEGTGSAFLRAKAAAVGQVEEAVGQGIPVSVWSGTRPELGSMDLKLPGAEAAPGSGGELSQAAEDASKLLGDLRGRETTDTPLHLAALLNRFAERLDSSKAEQTRVVALVSDFRASDWFEPGSGALRSDLEASLLELKKRGALGRIRWKFIDVGQPSRENAAVTSVHLSTDHPLAKVPTRIIAEVRNFGTEVRRHVTGEIEILEADAAAGSGAGEAASGAGASSRGEGSPGQRLHVTHHIPLPAIENIPPGKTATAEVDFTFDRAGTYPIAVHVEADRLARDDSSFAVAHVLDGLRALVVDGDPGPGRFSGESGFLLLAAAPRGALPSGILPRKLPGELTPQELRGVDVVLLLNRASISPGESEALNDFIRKGGGAAFFLGNKVTSDGYRGLKGFPATIGAIQDARPRVHMRLGEEPRGGFAVYRGIEGPSIEKVGFDRYFSLTALEGAFVAARFDDSAGTPAVVESSAGKGKTALFNLTADRDWGDWPTDPSYPIALQEWIRYLAPKRAAALLVTAGDVLAWEPAAGVEYSVLPPQGPPSRVEARALSPESTRTASFGATHRAGFYVVQAQARAIGSELEAGALSTQVFACRRDPRESDLEAAGETRLRAALGTAGVDFVMASDPGADAFQKGQEGETWRWLAYAAGGVLLLELLLAWWFGRS